MIECGFYKNESTGHKLPQTLPIFPNASYKRSLEKLNSYKIANMSKCWIMMIQVSVNSTTGQGQHNHRHLGPVSQKHQEFTLSYYKRERLKECTMWCLYNHLMVITRIQCGLQTVRTYILYMCKDIQQVLLLYFT